MAAIFERVNKIIKQIAEAEKYDIIFQEAVYANPRIDITDKVIKALGDGGSKPCRGAAARRDRRPLRRGNSRRWRHGDFPHRHAGNAGAGDLAFLANPKYRHQLATTRAAAVIMAPPAVDGVAAAILTPQPYLYYARVAQWLNPPPGAGARHRIRPRWSRARSPRAPASGPTSGSARRRRSARCVIIGQLQHR
jgi:hypothetical protein